MSQTTAETIEEYFENCGWNYARSAPDTWITGIRTSVSSFQIFVRLTDDWVFFFINPFVVGPPDPADRLRLYYHALRYNLDMNFAKLGLDPDGDLFMVIEMPAEDFTFNHFVNALDGISHHASAIYTEIFSLAHNADYIEGRYDNELEGLQIPSITPPDDEEGDVMIAGRRLKITTDEGGAPRVELESDEESETDESDDTTPPETPSSDLNKPTPPSSGADTDEDIEPPPSA